jgi:ParB-like chromosome segregation protein Spo0J
MALENPLVKKVSIPALLTRGAVLLFAVLLALAAVVYLQYREIAQASRHAAATLETGDTLLMMAYDLERLTARDGNLVLTRLNLNAQKVGRSLSALTTDEGDYYQILKPTSAFVVDRLLKQLQDEWQPIERSEHAAVAKGHDRPLGRGLFDDGRRQRWNAFRASARCRPAGLARQRKCRPD